MDSNLDIRVQSILNDFSDSKQQLKSDRASLEITNKKLEQCLTEQKLIEDSMLAMKAVRPLLSQSSIKQCEELANAAIAAIFELPYKVVYDPKTERFVISKGDFEVDLADGEGGGWITVISFVMQVYLVIKLQKRRIFFMDEAFTQISDRYFDRFIGFIRQLCSDLDCSLCLVTHDRRIEEDMVDHDYLVKDGMAIKQK